MRVHHAFFIPDAPLEVHLPAGVVHPVNVAVPENRDIGAHAALPWLIRCHDDLAGYGLMQPQASTVTSGVNEKIINEQFAAITYPDWWGRVHQRSPWCLLFRVS